MGIKTASWSGFVASAGKTITGYELESDIDGILITVGVVLTTPITLTDVNGHDVVVRAIYNDATKGPDSNVVIVDLGTGSPPVAPSLAVSQDEFLAETEKYTQDNAASIDTEVNAVTGWTPTNATIVSDAVEHTDGSYGLKIESTGTYGRADYSFTTVIGKTYRIKIWAKRGATGTAQNLRQFEGFGTTAQALNVIVTDTTWRLYERLLVAEATTGIIKGYSGNAGASGDILYIDKISILESDLN